mmetsp:Transcript_40612/g.36051  ORF Transcript_40612/g.36051 Transcript_40612/m.36051 type:complete len:90 (+) Transcript_40612:1111-1380(+)
MLMKGHLYAPNSRTFNMSFLEVGMVAEVPLWNKSGVEGTGNRYKSMYLTGNKEKEPQSNSELKTVDIPEKKMDTKSPDNSPEVKKKVSP